MTRTKKSRGGGGNAHDRAKERATNPPNVPNDIPNEVPSAPEISATGRVLRFFDQPSLQTLLGIVGGLVGVFLDGRYFALLGVLASLALYRSNALIGLKRKLSFATHMILIFSVSTTLYFMGIQLNKSRVHTYTPADYASAVRSKLPLPISQQVTNIYNSFAPQERQIGEPRVDLSEFFQTGFNEQGMTFATKAVNNGNLPALDVLGTTSGFMRTKSKESEGEIFKYLEQRSYDTDAPKIDQPPGATYERIEPLFVPTPAGQDQQDFFSGAKVVYLARIDTYKDAKGNRYSSEICMYMRPRQSTLMFCDGHNKVRRISGTH